MNTTNTNELRAAVAEAIKNHPEIIQEEIRNAGGWAYWVMPQDVLDSSGDDEPPTKEEVRLALTSNSMDEILDYGHLLEYVHSIIEMKRKIK